MRSIGARLALWYALVTLVTMVGVFTAGRYLLEKYVVHSLDLLNEDEFAQIRLQLGDGYAALTPAQIQDRLREITGYGSVLFYVDIHRRTGETLFRSKNLGGHAITPEKPWTMRFALQPTPVKLHMLRILKSAFVNGELATAKPSG